MTDDINHMTNVDVNGGVPDEPLGPKLDPVPVDDVPGPVVDYGALEAARPKATVEETYGAGKIIYVIIEVDRSNGNNVPTTMDYDREAIVAEAQSRAAVVVGWPIVADFR